MITDSKSTQALSNGRSVIWSRVKHTFTIINHGKSDRRKMSWLCVSNVLILLQIGSMHEQVRTGKPLEKRRGMSLSSFLLGKNVIFFFPQRKILKVQRKKPNIFLKYGWIITVKKITKLQQLNPIFIVAEHIFLSFLHSVPTFSVKDWLLLTSWRPG